MESTGRTRVGEFETLETMILIAPIVCNRDRSLQWPTGGETPPTAPCISCSSRIRVQEYRGCLAESTIPYAPLIRRIGLEPSQVRAFSAIISKVFPFGPLISESSMTVPGCASVAK